MNKGKKFDEGKLRIDLVDPKFIFAVAEILTFGAKKYAAENWRKGIVYSRIVGAVLRHLYKWIGGEKLDPESGFSHLWHVACNVHFLIVFEAEERTELDDLYNSSINVEKRQDLDTYEKDTVNITLNTASSTDTLGKASINIEPLSIDQIRILPVKIGEWK